MSKSLSNQLQELKPLLPKRYQFKLSKKLKDVPRWRIKRAFAGQSQPDDIIRKIFSAASRMSKKHLEEQAEAMQITSDLQKIAAEIQ